MCLTLRYGLYEARCQSVSRYFLRNDLLIRTLFNERERYVYRYIHLNKFLSGHYIKWNYATYLINASNVWLLCIVHTNLSINGKKTKTFSCTKQSMRNGRCENRFVLGLLVHSTVVVEFGRKVFLVDCLLGKALITTKISIAERAKACSCIRKSITIQWNITGMRYRNDFIQSGFHIHTNLGMVLARDYASCYATRSTLVMIVADNVQNLRGPAKSLDIQAIQECVG